MSNSKNNDIKSNIIKLANELLQICHNEHDDTARSRSAGATLSQTVQANQLDQPAEIKRLRVHLRKHLQHGTHRYIDTQFLLIGQC